jgi:hypothetical protein
VPKSLVEIYKKDTTIRGVVGLNFSPRKVPAGDHLRQQLLDSKLAVLAITGSLDSPDMVLVCGDSVREALPCNVKSLGEGIASLAFGCEQGDLKEV